ncbi:MAG: hypothetical protein JWO46_2452 [Nocardioidaceae bacterium]|nr:hypothetical protein [Nocardioidaceae bacterium]
MGKCTHSTQQVSLRDDLDQAERRASLLHELEHLDGGPAVRGYVQQDELATRERAARWLIPFEDLVRGLLWADDEEELAEALWVDVHTVRTRLRTLTEVESRDLSNRMLAAEVTFPKF